MQLQGKSAVIYGAHSPLGTSVARALANEGASLYLAGRSTARLNEIADDLSRSGAQVEVSEVDPMNPKAVSDHLHQVVLAHGSVDISVNLTFMGIESPARLCNLDDQQFAAAALTRPRANFVTAAAAASEMAYQGGGLIVATSVPDGAAPEHLRAAQRIGSTAIEGLCNELRRDVGSFGVSVVFLPRGPSSGEELVQALVDTPPAIAKQPTALPNATPKVRVQGGLTGGEEPMAPVPSLAFG